MFRYLIVKTNSVVFLGCIFCSFFGSRGPIKLHAIDLNLIDLTPQELLKPELLAIWLNFSSKTTLFLHKVIQSMGINLPSLHLFVAGNSLCIFSVHIFVGHKDRRDVGVEIS